MSIADSILKMIRLTDEVKGMNNDIKIMDGKLENIDRRLVRVETVIEFTSKGLINKQLGNDTK